MFYERLTAKYWQEEAAMHSEWALDYMYDGKIEEAVRHQRISAEYAENARCGIGLHQNKKRKRGRPSINFDKRSYQREYMRRRRAKARADKEARNG